MTTYSHPAPPSTEARNKFLSKFSDNRKATVTNLFLSGPRGGLSDPQFIVADVISQVQQRLRRTTFEATAIRERLLLQTIQAFPEEALGFAAWALAYVQMPEADRAEHKRQMQEAHIQRWLSNQPASERQINYLRSLGHQGEVASKLHASQLIEHMTKGGRR